MRILYVEDEKFLADAVIHVLDKSGISVDWTADGEEGLDLAVKPIYDAIVLDVMLPGISGFDILKTLRERNIKTPIIMLSALSQAEDKIKGLNFGADDYLAKPFKTSELVARLRALIRRPPLQDEKVISFGDLYYNLKDRTLNDIHLSEKEAAIMESLLKNPDHVQSKEYLLAHVWGTESIGEENYVEVYISYLRKKLKKLNSKCKIKTIRSLGYKLCSKS
ncbi:response regulator transcription factor [Candidatus Saccharibacteria bacterium]|nr:response regulator transcription factor [Candidatus Saccharibacteria bacterium]MBQ3469806.1 response regulator transcription factor [Candidatus Saccharibacteria bacterium]